MTVMGIFQQLVSWLRSKYMRTALAGLFIVISAAVAVAQRPKTVDEAVQVIKAHWLKPKDIEWIRRSPKDEAVWTLYRPFGTGVRNQFGLWGDNQALRDSCGDNNPEGCSVVIFNRLWESVRNDTDQELLRQLDCQFQLVRTIHVSVKGFHQATTREMIRRLQSQINSQLSGLTTSSTPPCQTSLTLEVGGKPDMSCYVVAPHGKKASDAVNDMTLDRALATLGLDNLFRTIHYPPKLTLQFARKCQFERPFPW
jgi:hypothetical protein